MTIRKVMRGGEFSSSMNFLFINISLVYFFLGHPMNIFLGLPDVHDFFSI